MTLPETLDKISKALAVLTHQTSAENLAGLFSKNRITEDLLLPVFRLTLNSRNLQNVNQKTVNFPYIDLADDQARLAIQVTTERGAAKVTETLTKFIEHNYHKQYDRLIFFILTSNAPRYTAPTKAKWKEISGRKLRFDPARDILTPLDLFKHIQALPQSDIYAVHDFLAQSVIGEAFVDIESHLARQSRRQLDYEKHSGKYIPDIFIETRETKNLVRTFAHPTLFFRRTLDSLGRINIPGSNRFLTKAGLPALPFPDLHTYYSKNTLADVNAAAAQLLDKLSETTAILAKYEKESREEPPSFPIKAGCEPFYEENKYLFEWGFGSGLKYRLSDQLNELKAAQARVFILTGRAGQGKTNLVCDFVENFLVKHDIPCAYLSVRKISSIQTPELREAIQRLIFDGATQSFSDAAKLLSVHASKLNKPFVLIIDGLNEHHRISEFSAQLEQFIETVIEYPHLKLLLTCRSEFFQQRFGNLIQAPLDAHTFVLEAHERQRDEERYEEMQEGYFAFFKIKRELVSEQVIESLKSDILLLRFFCEAYGARGKPEGYQQPNIDNIYREQIFKIYLEGKLGAADLFLQRVGGKVNPKGTKGDLVAILGYAVKHMLETWQFSDVPISIIPASLNEALYALLGEELVLRRDAPSGASVFSPSEETINFTFDEFRDYLLAQYLLYRVYDTDAPAFKEYIARNDPKDSQIIEGIKKFLFYASRHQENEAFWNFYRNQPWYTDVYSYEVFNIDTKLLRAEDCDSITAILQAGGEEARMVARKLAVRWHSKRHPLLGLDLLLSFVIEADDLQFDNLVIATFRNIQHHHEGSSANAFCKFITERVLLPEFKPTSSGFENGLFLFLILMLPVDGSAGLESESVDVFRKLLELHPDYAINLLRESLKYRPTRHKPYVWRLLATYSNSLPQTDLLVIEAQQVQAQCHMENHALYREVSRFLECVCPSCTTPAL